MGINSPIKGTTSHTPVSGGTGAPSQSPSMTRLLEIQNEKELQLVKDSGGGGDGGEDDDDELLKLHDAVCEEDLDEIQELIEEDGGKLVFHQDDERNTPLHTVCLRGDDLATEKAKLLLGVEESEEYPYTCNVIRKEILTWQNIQGMTPLQLASRNRIPELVKALLRWGADPKLQDGKDGNTALHFAAESDTDNATECVRAILNCDPTRKILNVLNHKGQTALHKAIAKKCEKMVRFLVSIERGCDLGLKDKEGKTVLHHACSGPGENEKSVQVVKALLSKCTKKQINEADEGGRTALHIAAIQRLPMITLALVANEDADVQKRDGKRRTALHYATENGCYPKGYQCVEVLISKKFKEKRDAVNYLFKNEDDAGDTPFMLACQNCPVRTMEKYLTATTDPQHWLSEKYITMLYENCPLSVRALMDRAFCEDKRVLMDNDMEDALLVDYGSITGYVDPVTSCRQQETKYLFESLSWKYDTQKEILLHPLVQLFVIKKWRRLSPIITFWIIWQFIWLLSYTTLVLSAYRSGHTGSTAVAVVAATLMAIYILASILNESFEIYGLGIRYFRSVTNSVQILQNVLAIIAMAPVFANGQPEKWQKYTTAAGILLAYVLSMREIGKLQSKIGLVIEVLKQVLIQISQVLLCCSPLIIGFTLAFMIIFEEHSSLNSIFPKPIVKILVMMTGEIDFEDTFNNEEEEGGGEKGAEGSGNGMGGERLGIVGGELLTYRVIHLIFFLAFLISVPVGFYNLLTGFALDKVMELRERAKVGQLAKQVEHIYYIESLLLGLRPVGKVLSHEQMTYWLRKMNVTTIKLDNEQKFQTVFREKLRKAGGHLRNEWSFWDCICGGGKMVGRGKCCERRLSTEVIEQIYALGSNITERRNNELLQAEQIQATK